MLAAANTQESIDVFVSRSCVEKPLRRMLFTVQYMHIGSTYSLRINYEELNKLYSNSCKGAVRIRASNNVFKARFTPT